MVCDANRAAGRGDCKSCGGCRKCKPLEGCELRYASGTSGGHILAGKRVRRSNAASASVAKAAAVAGVVTKKLRRGTRTSEIHGRGRKSMEENKSSPPSSPGQFVPSTTQSSQCRTTNRRDMRAVDSAICVGI